MATFLVEAYIARSHERAARDSGREARVAAEQLSREGTSVRYVRTTFLPEDETCFYVFEAASADAVSEACRRAGISSSRIIRAVE